MPTSKTCGQCAACHVDFKQGDEAVFFGHVSVMKDKLEPGGVVCLHKPEIAVKVSHSHRHPRCLICLPCFANIKTGYLKYQEDQEECVGGA